MNREILRVIIHGALYKLHPFVPKKYIWTQLHSSEYHPNVDGIIARIQATRLNPAENGLLPYWNKHLKNRLEVSGKNVLEIGHGGGWYLAEMLDLGAVNVVGVEISAELNLRATKALSQLGYSDFQLLIGNGHTLSVLRGNQYNFIYANTVVQHLSTRTLKMYLKEITQLLSQDGQVVLQVLHTNLYFSQKRLSKSDLFSVAYTVSEFKSLLSACGFSIKEYAEIHFNHAYNFWGLYVLEK